MSFLRISVVFLIFTLFTLIYNVHASKHDFPGVVELVGYNNRRARMSQDFNHGVSFVTPPMKKTRADIERVKQNIEEYNKLLKIDTKKLSDQQKDMLERIVDRVARLKETLEIEKPTTTSNKKEINNVLETVTTLLPTTTESATSPITTTDQATTIKRDQSEARSNINNSNNLSTKNSNSSGNNGKSKAKVRTNTSRKPSTSTKTTTKRTTGISPSAKPTKAAVTPASSTSSGSFSAQKIATITTIPPQVKSHQKQQQQDVVHDVLMKQHNHQEDDAVEQKTLPSVADQRPQTIQQRNPLGAVGGSSDLLYASNVTASSIIDSLSNHAREDYYNRDSLSESSLKEKKPAETAKPTKYHYYPHNQHIYLLPECAIQQVCNAVYVRLNYTQPLCACPSRYRDPCSASLNEDDLHTTKLIGDGKKKAITLAKTCETTTEMRECRSPKDWSLLALQNTRTGKSHYLVICRCPDHYKLEGPMAHDQPTYASVPGIRVFGMMCVKPGYSIRRPSVQPPKRYQLQKPYYVPNSNKYGTNKDRLPNYQQESYQTQHQANYQYLSRPESSSIINSHTEFPESISLNSFSGIYGRNNEQKSDAIAAEVEESESSGDAKRAKRSVNELDDDVPEFPWHRLQKFQQSILWD